MGSGMLMGYRLGRNDLIRMCIQNLRIYNGIWINFKSCHPRHVKEAIPYGQSLRLRRICSSDNIFDERIKELKRNLDKRGFKKDKISVQCEKAKAKD